MKRVQSFNIAQAKKDMLLAFLLAVITRAQGDEKVTELSNNQLQALIAAYLLYEELAQRHRMNLLTKDVQEADTWMTQQYAAGERIVPPAEPEAFRWVDVPEFMPDHDITIYAQYVG